MATATTRCSWALGGQSVALALGSDPGLQLRISFARRLCKVCAFRLTVEVGLGFCQDLVEPRCPPSTHFGSQLAMGAEEVRCLVRRPRSFAFALDSLRQRCPGGPVAVSVLGVAVAGLGFTAPPALPTGSPSISRKLSPASTTITFNCSPEPCSMDQDSARRLNPTSFLWFREAGRADTLFTDDAAALIHATARSYPQAVNNLAISTLVAA